MIFFFWWRIRNNYKRQKNRKQNIYFYCENYNYFFIFGIAISLITKLKFSF